jgi:hypothetical protein
LLQRCELDRAVSRLPEETASNKLSIGIMVSGLWNFIRISLLLILLSRSINAGLRLAFDSIVLLNALARSNLIEAFELLFSWFSCFTDGFLTYLVH